MSAPYARPGNVAIRRANDDRESVRNPCVYVARLPSGPLLVLDGSAAVVWDAATCDGPDRGLSPENVVLATVADTAGVDIDDVRDDVLALLADLVRRGLLTPAG